MPESNPKSWRRWFQGWFDDAPTQYIPEAVPPALEQDQFTARFESSVAGAGFWVSFMVQWYRHGDTAQIGKRICASVQRFAEGEAKKLNVTQRQNLENILGGYLNSGNTIAGATIVRATVAVTVSEDEQATGREWDALKRKETIVQRRRKLTIESLHFERDEIYSHADLARTWWLRRHPDAIDDVVDDLFDRMAARFRAPTPDSVPSTVEEEAARLVHEFMADLTTAEQYDVLARLGVLFAHYRRVDLSERLPRQRSSSADDSPADNSPAEDSTDEDPAPEPK